jgi:hypothetical protein
VLAIVEQTQLLPDGYTNHADQSEDSA